MSVTESIALGIQKQLLNEKPVSIEVNTTLEADMTLQTSEGDIVTLSSNGERDVPLPNGEPAELDSGQTVQEISSVAQAASTFSESVGGGLNDDELTAIQKLAAKVEPIAKEFLSSDLEELDVEKAVDISLPSIVSVETDGTEFDVENIRELPALVSATIDAGFEKQFQALNKTNRELIVNSMSELMQFFREKVVQVLEPLRNASSLNGSGSQIPVETDLTSPTKA